MKRLLALNLLIFSFTCFSATDCHFFYTPAFSLKKIIQKNFANFEEIIKKSSKLKGNEDAWLLTLQGDLKVVIKPTRTFNEIDANKFSNFLNFNFVPYSENIMLNGSMYSVQLYVESKNKYKYLDYYTGNLIEGQSDFSIIGTNEMPWEFYFFDALLGNIDRSKNHNYLLFDNSENCINCKTYDLQKSEKVFVEQPEYIAIDNSLLMTDATLVYWLDMYDGLNRRGFREEKIKYFKNLLKPHKEVVDRLLAKINRTNLLEVGFRSPERIDGILKRSEELKNLLKD